MAQQHINYSLPNDGLGDTLRVSQIKAESNFNELYAGKVDKVVGQGLSDTNFTQLEKDKLAALDPDMAVQSDAAVTDPDDPAFIKNQKTNLSEFTNDGDGTEPFITDVPSAGNFVRTAGGWVALGAASIPEIFDGIIGVTAGFTVGQQDFTLPAGKKAVSVMLAHATQYKTTANNTALVNRWSQTGDTVTITKTPVLNNYIYIEYV